MTSEESLPLGVTTKSMYIDLGAVTPEALAISEKSRKLARAALGDGTPEDRIRQRCSIAVGDFEMAPLLRFQYDPVPAIIAALARNAPSSLLSACRLIESGVRPAVVIGTPVGFVQAAESKVELRKLIVLSISNEGTRGGTPVAVAAINECITMFVEKGIWFFYRILDLPKIVQFVSGIQEGYSIQMNGL